MIKQQLSQKQQQKLSPLQIQQVKLLELNSLEIENRINQELEENPALEDVADPLGDGEKAESIDDILSSENATGDDPSLDDYFSEDDIPDYKLQPSYYSKETQRESIPYAGSESFQEYLLNQLRLKNLSDEEFRIGEYLIGNLDEDGYLRRELQAISDDLAFQYGLDLSTEKIAQVLLAIQELDPAGIGATDLQNCLLLQLQRKELTPSRQLARTILEEHFDAFSKKQYEKIIRTLNLTDDELKDAIKEITLLNPKPGNSWENTADTKMAQIIPDFYVEASNGELYFSMLEQNVPELRINREYNDMLTRYSKAAGNKSAKENKEAILFVKQKIESAKWFIDAIKQRTTTLHDTMLAIIDIQRDFFLSGDEADLRPMILKDVAERSGYDISTISRVSNSKYVQTNWGVYPLKYFFSESLRNNEGEEISTREVKAILKTCIEAEDKSKPLTDDLLVGELKKRGYDIARRTVAKYREQLNIPIARLRKEI